MSNFLPPAISPMRQLSRRCLPALVLALFFLLSACGGPRDREEAAPPLGANGKPIPVMHARDAFADGQLIAKLTLSRGWGKAGFKPAPIPGLSKADDDNSDENNKITPDIIDALQHRRAASPLPPVMLWLTLTNAAKDPLKVEIVDFKSDLGDFAVQPDHVTLAPGGSVNPDPMISRLGVTSNKLPVTISLRINGHAETRVLTLKPVADETK